MFAGNAYKSLNQPTSCFAMLEVYNCKLFANNKGTNNNVTFVKKFWVWVHLIKLTTTKAAAVGTTSS